MDDWGLVSHAYVSAAAHLGERVELHPGAVIHRAVRIGAGTVVGAGAVVHAGTVVGPDCLIEDGAVLGKRPRLRRGSNAAGRVLEALTLAEEVTVCAGAVVYAGVSLGARVIVGDQAQVRELAVVGADSIIGRASCVDFEATVGERVSIQSCVYLTAGARVEDDVFIGPGVVTTNDDSMGRHAGTQPLEGPTFRRACRIGGAAVLVPGVEVGEEAFVAAGAVVTRDVAPREAVLGLPARVAWRVEATELLERWR